MGTDYTLQKCRSPESSRPYTENGVKKSGNFGLRIASVGDRGSHGESILVMWLSGPFGARCKNNFRRVLVAHFQATHPRLQEQRVGRDQFGHDGVAGFVLGPDLDFSGMVWRSGQRIL